MSEESWRKITLDELKEFLKEGGWESDETDILSEGFTPDGIEEDDSGLHISWTKGSSGGICETRKYQLYYSSIVQRGSDKIHINQLSGLDFPEEVCIFTLRHPAREEAAAQARVQSYEERARTERQKFADTLNKEFAGKVIARIVIDDDKNIRIVFSDDESMHIYSSHWDYNSDHPSNDSHLEIDGKDVP